MFPYSLGEEKKPQKKTKGGVFFFFAGNWPRLQTLINQSHVSTSNKDAAVVYNDYTHFKFALPSYIIILLITILSPRSSPDLSLYTVLYEVAHEEPHHQQDVYLTRAFVTPNRFKPVCLNGTSQSSDSFSFYLHLFQPKRG